MGNLHSPSSTTGADGGEFISTGGTQVLSSVDGTGGVDVGGMDSLHGPSFTTGVDGAEVTSTGDKEQVINIFISV